MEKAQLLRRLGWPYVSKLILRQTYLTMSTAPVYLAAVILAFSISKAGKSGGWGPGARCCSSSGGGGAADAFSETPEQARSAGACGPSGV